MTNSSNSADSSRPDNSTILATAMAYAFILRDIKKNNININELHKHKDRIVISLPIYDGIISNLEVMCTLIENQKSNEAYIISRSLIERIITFLYLQCCSDDEFERYIMYTSQKVYRKLNQTVEIKGKRLSFDTTDTIELDEYPGLLKALNTFTSKKSKKEITRWSNTSLPTKLELVGNSSIITDPQINIIILFLNMFYDDASEALHSTMYGCNFHFGGYGDPRKNISDEEIIQDYNDSMRHLLCISAMTTGVIISYMGKAYQIQDLDKVVRNLNQQIYAEIETGEKSK